MLTRFLARPLAVLSLPILPTLSILSIASIGALIAPAPARAQGATKAAAKAAARPATTTAAGPAAGAAAAFSGVALPQALRAQIDKAVAELTPALVETRRDIHMHPELGYREKRTSELVAARLRALKFDEVRTGIGGTGVVAVLKGGRPGPVVAVRADMDALPIPELIDVPYKSTVENVKHACGHDGHVSMALGVADVFSRLRAEIPGTVVFLFQPAEEGDPDGGTSGAQRMLEGGAFGGPKPAAIFGLHVMPTIEVGTIGYRPEGTMASSNRFVATITGKKTHGAYPHTGLDPVPIAAEVVTAWQNIASRQANAIEPMVLTVGSIHGGNRFNIIADSVRLEGTVRTLRKDGPDWVKARMEAILKGVTSSYGATYTFDFPNGNPVTYNDPSLTAASLPALEGVTGKGKLVVAPPQMGAEDFALYQEQIPGLFFFLGVGNEAKKITAMIHTEYFDMDEDALPLGARAMSNVVLDYLYRESAKK
jgi:amidohydrolase